MRNVRTTTLESCQLHRFGSTLIDGSLKHEDYKSSECMEMRERDAWNVRAWNQRVATVGKFMIH